MLAIFVGQSCLAGEDEWIYSVVAGDNPWNLTERYLDGFEYWPLLQKLNRIENPLRIPPGTRLRIPVDWLRARPASGRVVAVQGDAVLLRGDSRHPVVPGLQLKSGDALETAADGSATIEFGDRSRILLRAGSLLRLTELVQFENTDFFRTRVHLERGSSENLVTPKTAAPSRFESTTPSALTAVRGTSYRVNVQGTETRAEVLEGRVKVETAAAAVDLPEGFGTVARGSAAPSAPIALLPRPPAENVPRLFERVPLAFQPSPLAGAHGYRMQIAPDTNFAALLFEGTSDTNIVRGPNLPDGAYVMRLRGIDAQGIEGAHATVAFVVNARPEPPIVIAPPAGGAVADAQPTLQWTGSVETSRYHLQIARDERFEQLVVDEAEVATTSFTAPQPLEPGRYSWRVAAIDDQEGVGPFSDRQEFRRAPPGPVLDAPELDEEQLTLRWRAGLPGQQFQAQLAQTPAFDACLLDARTSEARVTIARPKGGSYFIRVRTIDVDGFEGPFEAPQRIEIPDKPRPWWPLLIPLLIPFLAM